MIKGVLFIENKGISLVTLCSLFGNLGTDYGNILSIEGVKDCNAQLKYFPRE